MIKEVQNDPVTNQPLHVDFYAVDEKRKIQAAVPIHCVGKAAGVTAGGTLQIVRREVSVEGLPLQLPQFLEVDVTALGVHQTVHIGDLILPVGITAVGEPHLTVLTVLAPVVAAKEEAEEAPTEAAGEQEVAADDGKAAPGAP